MNLDKIDLMLCRVFQDSNGPFSVKIHYLNGSSSYLSIDKYQIKQMSNDISISKIEMLFLRHERRWRIRSESSSIDRRIR